MKKKMMNINQQLPVIEMLSPHQELTIPQEEEQNEVVVEAFKINVETTSL